MRLTTEVVDDVSRDSSDALRVLKGPPVLSGSDFFLVLFRLDRLKLRADIVIVDLEFEHFLITDRIGDHVGM
ncbi:hypothetical protein D3C73_713970 [compost metagenome]